MVNELRLKNADIDHSLASQLSNIKDLSTSTKINTDALANLTAILTDQVKKSYDEFQRIAIDVLWLNVTLFGQSTQFMHITQLEFTLLHLTHQVDKLFIPYNMLFKENFP